MTEPSKELTTPPANLPAAPKPNPMVTEGVVQPKTFEEAYRFSQMLARSTIIPKEFQGSPENCMIAVDIAARTHSNWLVTMQHLYIVHGRPAFDSAFAIGLLNQSGQFGPLSYEEEGDDPKKQDYRVRAYSTRKGSGGEILYGPWIDWTLVKSEGWDKPKGESKQPSKWLTMADQMFHYRAAMWWIRRHCPEVMLGMQSLEELHDIEERREVESTVVGGNELARQKLAASLPDSGSAPNDTVASNPDSPPAPSATGNPSTTTTTGAVIETTDATLGGAEPAPEPPKFRCERCKATFLVKPASGLCPGDGKKKCLGKVVQIGDAP